MIENLKDYVNETLNDNRIFSYEDILAMDNEEGRHYQKAIEEQYGKIGFPSNKELAASDDVVYVREYTRDDGTVVRAHYRSKAGHGNPNKPVMKGLKEYKEELDKWVDEYMTRDAARKYGKTTGFAANTEIQEEIPELIPVNGVLTGGIEINRDMSQEVPVTNIQTEPSGANPPQSVKPAVNIKKPNTTQQKMIENIDLPEYELLKPIIPSTMEIEKFKRMQKPAVHKENKENEYIELIKKKDWDELTYRTLSSDDGYEMQKRAIRNRLTSWGIETFKYPNSTKYYRISSTHGQSILNGPDKDNYIFTVGSVQDEELKNHILSTMQSNGVTPKTWVVQPKEDARLTRDVKYSPTIINALKKYPDRKITNIDFSGESDLYKTLGHTHIYRPHKDKNGNIVVNIVDFYDFADTDERTFSGAMVKNAYRQQEEGDLTNYVLLVELKYTPAEWEAIISN